MRTARVLLAAVVLAAACDDAALPAADPDAAPDALLREVQARGYREWTRPPKHEMRIATNAPHGNGVEVFVDEEPRRRTLDADQEVLDTAVELAGLGQDLVLVTDDAGLELRARAQEVAVCRMDPRYLRRKLAAES